MHEDRIGRWLAREACGWRYSEFVAVAMVAFALVGIVAFFVMTMPMDGLSCEIHWSADGCER